MGWTKVAEGTYEEVTPLYGDFELPHGAGVKFEFDTEPGAAHLLNIWDSDVRQELSYQGIYLTKTYTASGNKYVCEGFVNTPPVMAIAFIVLGIIAAFALAYLIKQVRMSAESDAVRKVLPDIGGAIFTPANVAIIAAGGAIAIMGIVAVRELTRG